MSQSKVCLQIPIVHGKESALSAVLNTYGNPASADSAFPFQQFSKIHFARWFIVPGTIIKGKPIPASVMYAANIDETPTKTLTKMFKIAIK